MRISAVVALLVVVGFAGCIGDDTTTGTDSVEAEEDPQAKYKAAEPNTEMPEREFEGEVVLTSSVLEAAPESNLNFTMNVTDLHDYDFPLTFIDWALFYNRAPNPVAEGDATDLEASYNHTFYAEDYHMFGFRADDGQGFKDLEIVIVEIGEPENPYPNATQIQEFRNRTEEYFQQAEEEVEEVEEEVEEVVPAGIVTNVHSAFIPDGCYGCVDGANPATGTPGAMGCAGYMQMNAGMDCAWVPITPASWGETFTVTSDIGGSPGSVDVEFMTHCRAVGNVPGLQSGSVSQEYIDGGAAGPLTGTIPEGSGCMVAFEFHWPTLPSGHTITFEWDERIGDPYPTVTQNLYQSINTCGGVGCNPADCPGMEEGINGLGCVWFPVTERMWGRSFSITSTPGYTPLAAGAGLAPGHAGTDPDARALDACSHEANVLQSYGAGGSESGVIPEGTTCMMTYEWTGDPALLRFTVDGDE